MFYTGLRGSSLWAACLYRSKSNIKRHGLRQALRLVRRRLLGFSKPDRETTLGSLLRLVTKVGSWQRRAEEARLVVYQVASWTCARASARRDAFVETGQNYCTTARAKSQPQRQSSSLAWRRDLHVGTEGQREEAKRVARPFGRHVGSVGWASCRASRLANGELTFWLGPLAEPGCK